MAQVAVFLHTHTNTHSHLLCPPLSSSASFLSFHPVLYICHIGVPPMQPVPAPIPCSPSEMCSSKHFTPAYAKGKWQRQVCDRQGTVCAQGLPTDEPPSPLSSPLPTPLAFIFRIMDTCDWRKAFDDTFVLFIKIRARRGRWGKKKHC